MMEIKERIKFARERAGLNQTELSRLLQITPQSVQKWEQGTSNPKIARLREVAKALNISESWLLNGTGSINPCDTPADDDTMEEKINYLLDQMDAERQKDAVELLEAMIKQQNILRKYGL